MTDLFTLADERLTRIPDHETSIAAAKAILPCRKVLQEQIVNALIVRGPMTDGELERLPMFSGYGPSTVRKRRSELYQAGRVVPTGARRHGMKEWVAS